MCGIVGYIGAHEASPILVNGLRRLEYRGYDSAGIAVIGESGLAVIKTKGRVEDLHKALGSKNHEGTIGIGHTRWATHDEPSDVNAHPQLSADGRIASVHNGIIENYAQLKEELARKGLAFKSQTDTEVLANLIATIASEQKISLFAAVQAALHVVRGAYAIAVLDREDPNSIVSARKSSPLAIGIGNHEFVIGSDATPIIAHTNQIVYLNDDEVAALNRDGSYEIVNIAGKAITPEVHALELSLDKLEKDGFPHFMLKEINQQPDAVRDTMRGRLSSDETTIMLGGISDYESRILRAPKLTVVACGTSWHAALTGKYIIEELAGIPVEVDYSSEFRYRRTLIGEHDVVLAISQSGETADTLAAVELAKQRKALTLGLVNVVGSSIARSTDAGVYTHAGPEISVASTKAFTTQVAVLTLMALRFAQQLGTRSKPELQALYQQLAQLPDWIKTALQADSAAKHAADYINGYPVALYLGRNNCFPVALEGALKIKEISYVAAEGYPAGEMKHGPIAMIEKGTPVVVIVPSSEELHEKMISNIQEVKARGAYVIAAGHDKHGSLSQFADCILRLPDVPDIFLPTVAAIPLQLLAYHSAVLKGNNVDMPRNLAKSVTVE